MRIASSTGGGDPPGLDALMRAAVLETPKHVEVDHDTVLTAQATGISLGDWNAQKEGSLPYWRRLSGTSQMCVDLSSL
jgi:hypothetical protein